MPHFKPEESHAALLEAARMELSFQRHRRGSFDVWRGDVYATLRRLLGPTPELCDLAIRPESEQVHAEFREIRFRFTSEPNVDVPCHLLLPKASKGPFPVVICLQGHTSGMHLSIGRAIEDGDVASIEEGNDFGVQAVRHGLAALVMEQRCFGERRDGRPPEVHLIPGGRCQHASMTALLLGRTMIGERAWDVCRAVDVLTSGEFDEVDAGRVGCMGNSGGGTTTLFASCLDQRITAVMPSCYVCTFRDSIASIDHCVDNYVPGILKYFEMGDLAGLLVPRPLVVVAGREDPIFPIRGVEETFETMQEIYRERGAADRCRLIVGEGGHRFYPEQAWPAFKELTGW